MSNRGVHEEALRERIARWNQLYPIGTKVHSRVYPDRTYRTNTPATLLFNRKAVIHLEGCNGYFDLDEVQPLAEQDTTAHKRIAVLFPGQGAQNRGMGRELFAAFPEKTRLASEVLGYSIERLCVEDPDSLLDQTRYTQVAVYVVNALGYYQHLNVNPTSKAAFLLGHSVGEYNALLAADVFNFETGLRLVMKRGELMGALAGGTMAAVLGASPEQICEIFRSEGVGDVDLANYNTPTQTVISGPVPAIQRAMSTLATQHFNVVQLRVSGAFHSRYMRDVQQSFAEYAAAFRFAVPSMPVIANATSRPYEPGSILEILCAQITSPVRWMDSVRHVQRQGEVEFVEIGSTFLRSMVREISAHTAA